MSTKKTNKSQFAEIMSRLMTSLGLKNEYELGQLLGFKKDTFSARKTRGSIPQKEIKLLCAEKLINFDWALTGEGSMKKDEGAKAAGEGFPLISDYQLESTDPNLVELIGILQEESPETVKFVLNLLKSRKLHREALQGLKLSE